jgi:hypothetical protein
MEMDLGRLQSRLEPDVNKTKFEEYIKLLRLEDFGASVYRTKHGTSKSHSHIGSVSLIQTSVEICMHLVVLEIGQKSKRSEIE